MNTKTPNPPELIEKRCKDYFYIVLHQAKSFKKQYRLLDLNELISRGQFALFKAAQGFLPDGHPDNKISFEVYARFSIRNRLKDYVRYFYVRKNLSVGIGGELNLTTIEKADESYIQDEKDKDKVEDIFKFLSPDEQKLLSFRYLEDHSLKEVGIKYNQVPSTMSYRLQVILRKCRYLIKKGLIA